MWGFSGAGGPAHFPYSLHASLITRRPAAVLLPAGILRLRRWCVIPATSPHSENVQNPLESRMQYFADGLGSRIHRLTSNGPSSPKSSIGTDGLGRPHFRPENGDSDTLGQTVTVAGEGGKWAILDSNQ